MGNYLFLSERAVRVDRNLGLFAASLNDSFVADCVAPGDRFDLQNLPRTGRGLESLLNGFSYRIQRDFLLHFDDLSGGVDQYVAGLPGSGNCLRFIEGFAIRSEEHTSE